MLNKELGESACVACSPISSNSASMPVDGQLTGMASTAKNSSKQTGALNQHLPDGFSDSTSVRLRLRSIGDPICNQTSRGNLDSFNNKPLHPDQQAASVQSDSKPKMNRSSVNSSVKFRSGSIDPHPINQRPAISQCDTDSDSVQLLDECNGSETDSDLQIVFRSDSNLNDSVILSNIQTEKNSSDHHVPLIDLGSSSSDSSSNADVGLDEYADSGHNLPPKHNDLNTSLNNSLFVETSSQSDLDPTDSSKKLFYF